MLKKFFYGMMAATMLVATSCTDEPMVGGDESTVSFSISTPEIATRAFSEGTKATQLQYAVYDNEGNILPDLTVTDGEINGKTTVSLKLKTGKTYNVVFWADNEDAPYTVDFAAKTMTIDYSNVTSNNENYDAFYKAQEITVKGDASINVELRRPFAQLNIGTNDMAAATAAGYTVNQTWVKVPAYNTLNLWDGSVNYNGSDIPQTQTFALANIPSGETFPVEGYKYLAMNYILVGTTQELVDIEFGLENNNIAERKVGSVPVRRNYRTNIYGSLLTSNQDVNVEIKPGYDGQATLDALHNAALNGGTVVLEDDVELTTPLQVYSTMTINLNGHTITSKVGRDADNNRVHVIINNAQLNIKNGIVKSEGANGGSAIYNNEGATLNIEDVELYGAPLVDGAWPSYAINNYGNLTINRAKINTYHGAVAVGGDGVAVVNDATIDVGQSTQTKQTSWALYSFENGQLTVNGGTFKNTKNEQNKVYGGGYICAISTKETLINGGTFDKTEGDNNGSGIYYNCTNLVIKGGTFDTNPSKYVADGYAAIENNGVWTVVATANSAETLAAAIENGGVVVLTSEITLSEAIAVSTAATINLNGKEIKSEASDGFVVSNGGELTISGNGKVTTNGAPIRAIGGKVVVEGGEFTQTGAWNTAVSTYRYGIDSREGGEIIINGGVFKTNNGMINVSPNSSVVIEGGNFVFDNTVGGTRHFAYVSGNLTIKDGEFKGVASSAAGGEFFCGAGADGKVVVEGGKFTSLWTSGSKNNIWSSYASGSSIEVKGGIFNHNGGISTQVIENTDATTKDAYPYMAK